MPMATKVEKIVIYLDGFLPIKQHVFLITWSSKITWKNKIIISTTQCLWLANVVGC